MNSDSEEQDMDSNNEEEEIDSGNEEMNSDEEEEIDSGNEEMNSDNEEEEEIENKEEEEIENKEEEEIEEEEEEEEEKLDNEQDMNSGSESETELTNDLITKKVRRRKPGIIYLSSIPSSMNVSKVRDYFSKFAPLGRVYLQPIKEKAGKKSKRLQFSEGWIEFKSKRKAKYIQQMLNNHPVGGKKSNPDYDTLWNIKYLPRFKWDYLTKRLEYESEVFMKRMGAEVSQVNKEIDHYLRATVAGDKMKRIKDKEGKSNKGEEVKGKNSKREKGRVIKQKKTEDEILKKKAEKKKKDKKYIKNIQKNKEKKQKLKKNKNNTDDFISSIFVGANK